MRLTAILARGRGPRGAIGPLRGRAGPAWAADSPRLGAALFAACWLAGVAALGLLDRRPDSLALRALATAPGWPWVWAAWAGGRVWARGAARAAGGWLHWLAVYAGGTALAIIAETALAASRGGGSALAARLPCGPLDPLCGTLYAYFVQAMAAGYFLGAAFPAALCPLAAAGSAALLGGRAPVRARLAAAVVVAAAGWHVTPLVGWWLTSG